jgi:hypothetical protein
VEAFPFLKHRGTENTETREDEGFDSQVTNRIFRVSRLCIMRCLLGRALVSFDSRDVNSVPRSEKTGAMEVCLDEIEGVPEWGKRLHQGLFQTVLVSEDSLFFPRDRSSNVPLLRQADDNVTGKPGKRTLKAVKP